MRINVAVPEAHVDAPVLDAALESVTRLNESLLSRNEVPTFERGLKHGVKWKPEPPGAEHFDSADQVLRRKWGDCDDLAPWHAASLRHTGEDPEAKAIVRKSGPKRWHAVVQRSDGSIDDPSLRAGMGPNIPAGVFGVAGAYVPLMLPPQGVVGGAYIMRPQIAMRPIRGQVQARADLPWHWREHLSDAPSAADIAMTTLHTAPVASTALVGAIDNMLELAEASGLGHPDHIDRLSAIADAVQGMHYDELAHLYGDENAHAAAQVVGSFFGKMLKGMSKAAISPFTATAAFIKKPSLKSFGNVFTSPITSHMKAVQPLAKGLKPFAGALKMVPIYGQLANSAIDILAKGPPKNLADFGRTAFSAAQSFAPGVVPQMPQGFPNPFGGGQQQPQPIAHEGNAQAQFAFNPFANAPGGGVLPFGFG